MKLYATDHSPFVERVLMAAQALGVELELVTPPQGTSSSAYRVRVPTGLVPALIIDEGLVLPESEAIVEYLVDRYGRGELLRPLDPALCARARLLSRLADLHLAAPLREMFEQAKRTPPDAAAVGALLPRIRTALVLIEFYLDRRSIYAVGTGLSQADCALVPLLFFVQKCSALDMPEVKTGLLASAPGLQSYFENVTQDPIVVDCLRRMERVQARRAEERARTGRNQID